MASKSAREYSLISSAPRFVDFPRRDDVALRAAPRVDDDDVALTFCFAERDISLFSVESTRIDILDERPIKYFRYPDEIDAPSVDVLASLRFVPGESRHLGTHLCTQVQGALTPLARNGRPVRRTALAHRY